MTTRNVATSAERSVDPSAMMLVTVLFLVCMGLAMARNALSSAPAAGSRGTSQRTLLKSTIQLPGVVDVHAVLEPVELNDDGQSHRRLACRDGDDENGKDMAIQIGKAKGKGDQ